MDNDRSLGQINYGLKRPPRTASEEEVKGTTKRQNCAIYQLSDFEKMPLELIGSIFNQLGDIFRPQACLLFRATCRKFNASIERLPNLRIYMLGFHALKIAFSLQKNQMIVDPHKNEKQTFPILFNLHCANDWGSCACDSDSFRKSSYWPPLGRLLTSYDNSAIFQLDKIINFNAYRFDLFALNIDIIKSQNPSKLQDAIFKSLIYLDGYYYSSSDSLIASITPSHPSLAVELISEYERLYQVQNPEDAGAVYSETNNSVLKFLHQLPICINQGLITAEEALKLMRAAVKGADTAKNFFRYGSLYHMAKAIEGYLPKSAVEIALEMLEEAFEAGGEELDFALDWYVGTGTFKLLIKQHKFLPDDFGSTADEKYMALIDYTLGKIDNFEENHHYIDILVFLYEHCKNRYPEKALTIGIMAADKIKETQKWNKHYLEIVSTIVNAFSFIDAQSKWDLINKLDESSKLDVILTMDNVILTSLNKELLNYLNTMHSRKFKYDLIKVVKLSVLLEQSSLKDAAKQALMTDPNSSPNVKLFQLAMLGKTIPDENFRKSIVSFTSQIPITVDENLLKAVKCFIEYDLNEAMRILGIIINSNETDPALIGGAAEMCLKIGHIMSNN